MVKLIRTLGLMLALPLMLIVAVGDVQSVRADFEPPPPPKPHRRKAGESFPPLPLPVTPLRRTEKKRPPEPPALIGKLQYGKKIVKKTADGRTYSYYDWQGDTTDAHNLVNQANRLLNIQYRWVYTNAKTFSYTPAELPILYITGHHAFKFTDEQRQKLRWYLRDGGMLMMSPCCGSNAFRNAAFAETKLLFPQRPLRPIPPDHPLYSCFYKIKKVKARDTGEAWKSMDPPVRGISLGCRLAVVMFDRDVCCGWAGHTHPKGLRVEPSDARKLGVNLISYFLANYQLGKQQSVAKVYHEDSKKTREEFIFPQVVHTGDWDPSPSAAMNLLKFLGKHSTMEVQFKRVPIDLGKTQAFSYPFIYMTGHEDFAFTDAEIRVLRSYLANGGVLLADACCGRGAFDKAFRRELQKVLPKNPMKELSPKHPIYNSLVPITKVTYTDWLREKQPDLKTPKLEGVTSGGVLCVIYSRYGLGSQWDGLVRPYARAYSSGDAVKLGANIITYAMTH
jgi:uncharacterized protein DUF4159